MQHHHHHHHHSPHTEHEEPSGDMHTSPRSTSSAHGAHMAVHDPFAFDINGAPLALRPTSPESQQPPPEQGTPHGLYLDWLFAAAQGATGPVDPFSWMGSAGAAVGAHAQGMEMADNMFNLHPAFLASAERGQLEPLPMPEPSSIQQSIMQTPVTSPQPSETPPSPSPPPSDSPSPSDSRSARREGDFKCEFCHESFTRRHDVKRHQKKGMLVCYIGNCPRRGGQLYSTPRYDAMKRHLTGAHNVKERDVPSLEMFERQTGVGGCPAMNN